MTDPGIAVAILAAGTGTRFGGPTPKPLVEVRGRPMVAWALDAAIGSGLRPIVLVVGHRGNEVGRIAPQGVGVVRASAFRRGIAHSLRAALKALDGWAQVEAVIVGLGDQPNVGPGAYERLAAAFRSGVEFGVATYGGERGNPVLLARAHWSTARTLRGDEGARALMRSIPVAEIPCDGTGDPRDIDTLDDLRAIERQLPEGE